MEALFGVMTVAVLGAITAVARCVRLYLYLRYLERAARRGPKHLEAAAAAVKAYPGNGEESSGLIRALVSRRQHS